MKKQGFTLMELIISIVLVGIVLASMIGTLLSLKNTYNVINDDIEAKTYSTLVSKVINEHIMENNGIKGYACLENTCELTLGTNKTMKLEIVTATISTTTMRDNNSNDTIGSLIEKATTINYYGDGYSYYKTLKYYDRHYDETSKDITSGYKFTDISYNDHIYTNDERTDLKDYLVNITIGMNNPKYNIEIYSTSVVDEIDQKRLYKLTYNSNGGTTCPNNPKVASDRKPWGTLCKPQRVNYGFTGWYIQRDGIYTKEVTKDTLALENLVVYARWDDKRYSCTEGKYLPAGKTNCEICPEGSYCPGITNVLFDRIDDQGRFECATGYNSVAGSKNVSQCRILCDNNEYLKTAYNTSCTHCSKGYTSTGHYVSQGNTSRCELIPTDKPVIESEETEVIYGSEDITLTCPNNNEYDDNVTKLYQFGYATSEAAYNAGNITWIGSPSTSNTMTISKTAFVGTRYYGCRTSLEVRGTPLYNCTKNAQTSSVSCQTSAKIASRTCRTAGTLKYACSGNYVYSGNCSCSCGYGTGGGAITGGPQTISGTCIGESNCSCPSHCVQIPVFSGASVCAKSCTYNGWDNGTACYLYEMSSCPSGYYPIGSSYSCPNGTTSCDGNYCCKETTSTCSSLGSQWTEKSVTYSCSGIGGELCETNKCCKTETSSCGSWNTTSTTYSCTNVGGTLCNTNKCCKNGESETISGWNCTSTNNYGCPEGGTYNSSTGKCTFPSSSPYSQVVASETSVLIVIKNVRVDFNSNSGTLNGTSPLYVKYNNASFYDGEFSSTTKSAPTVSKTGYTNTGWWTQTSGGSKVLKPNGTLTGSAVSDYTNSSNWVATTDKTLYAQYTANQYIVRYDCNGGTKPSGKLGDTTATYDEVFKLSTDVCKRDGYTQSGWNTAANGSGSIWTVSNTNNVNWKWNLTNNLTLYAVWVPQKLTITYNKNDGTDTKYLETITYDGNMDDNNFAPTSSIGTRSAYSFSGWSFKSDGSDGVRYAFTAPVGETWFLNQVGNNNVTTINLYAIWTAKPLRIYYHSNTGTFTGTTYKSYNNWVSMNGTSQFYQTVNVGSTVDLYDISTFGLDKTGYIPVSTKEWCTNANGSGTCFDQNRTYASSNVFSPAIEKESYFELPLYAHWITKTIKITFNKNGGAGGTDEMWFRYGTNKFYSNSSCTTEITAISNPTRSGYSFTGYVGNGANGAVNNKNYVSYYSGSTFVQFASDLSSNIHSDTTLNASWTACGAGKYLSGNTCQLCPAGTYSSGTANTTCSNCTAGYYCGAGSTSPTQNTCTGRTKYSAAGAASCSDVSSGYYTTGCDSSGNKCTGQNQCTAGTYCSGGVQSNCTGRTKYSAAGAASCSTTSDGYYTTGCDSSGNKCTGQNKCVAGNYCSGGVSTACGAGKYSSAGATSCSNISAGCYGTSATTACPNTCSGRNNYSAAGSASCSTVSDGYYSTGCDSSGNKCTGQSKCPSGSSCNNGILSSCTGRTQYSSPGATGCSSVSTGYYTTGCDSSGNNCTGQSKCPAGSYCINGIATLCGGGKYSAAGSTSCSNISAGCYGTSAATACPNSCTGRTKYSAAGKSACSDVSSGYYTTGCDSSGNKCTGQSQCAAGNYCSGGVSSACGAGKYSSAGSTSCSNISAGCYGTSATTACPNSCTGRTKYSAAGKSACSDVSSGYYTTGCNSSGNNCTGQSQCAAGTYCSGGISSNCTGRTKYSAAGKTSCSTVSTGYYTTGCNSSGNNCTGQSQCPAGSSCNNGIATVCGAGKYSSAGSTSCSNISAGCYGTSATTACPNSCTGRTKYSAAGKSECSTVSSGYYTTGCNSSGNNCTGQSQCTKGNYCTGGISHSCGTGYTTSGAGATSSSACYATTTFAFSYTGKFKVGSTEYTNTSWNTTNTNWEVQFLTTGTLTISQISSKVDAYVVGGGGGGGGAGLKNNQGSYAGAGGGGGGAAKRVNNFSLTGTQTITIGSGGTGAQSQTQNGGAGGTTSLGSLITAGGGSGGSKCGGIDANASGGAGGSTTGGSLSGTAVNGATGGNGGCRNSCTHYNGVSYKGQNGSDGSLAFGAGTTKYGASGGGGAHSWANGNSNAASTGGTTGGGAGAVSTSGGGYANHGGNATVENTGAGGGGASGGGCISSFPTCGHGGNGAKGIVIIRNAR